MDGVKQIKIKVFGAGVKIFGRLDLKWNELSLDKPVTIQKLKQKTGLRPNKPYLITVNGQKVFDDYVINNKDQIKFILPFSGG